MIEHLLEEPLEHQNLSGMEQLMPPKELKLNLPVTQTARETVREGRQTIRKILKGEDGRFLVIAGPCSIHDPEAALEYARRLAKLKHELGDRLYIVMRVYFEKPRTTIGWKGLIYDPHLNDSFDIQEGLRIARNLLLDINELGLPVATEFLDPTVPQYIGDLVSWAAIGARTTESQTHRQMASGLTMPVGFKNTTEGNLQIAIDAMTSARSPHHFLGIDDDGRTCVVKTKGNKHGHLLLRGGNGKPNYHPDNVKAAEALLVEAGLDPVLMVDCSHANSHKKHEKQETVWRSIIEQRSAGNRAIIGGMLESNLKEGNQKLPKLDEGDASGSVIDQLFYGVSITDACIGWDKTVQLLRHAYASFPN